MIIFFRSKKLISFLVIMCIAFNFRSWSSAMTLSDNEILAKSCAVMDGYSDRILFDKNARAPMANASTTKIMTCILALEYSNLNDYVLISRNAANQPKVRLGMEVGKEYLLKDLVYGLMLESFNDCAVAIAEHVSGSVDAFTEQMNKKAEELGCEDTYFITPNGLDAEKKGKVHHTTAADLCRIMKYCVWESPCAEQFLDITQTLNYECMDMSGRRHLFVNHNQLYASDECAISGKTGYTAKAGYCYVTAYEKNGLRFCIALLGCGWPNHKEYKWIDSRRLIEQMKKEYRVVDLKQGESEINTHVVVTNGFRGKPMLDQWNKKIMLKGVCSPNEQNIYKYLCPLDEQIDSTIRNEKEISAPIISGKKIGVLNFYLGNEKLISRDIISEETIRAWNLKYMFEAIFLCYF